MSQLLGQSFVIENWAAAGGILGFAEVAKADPDGYTLVTSSSSVAGTWAGARPVASRTAKH